MPQPGHAAGPALLERAHADQVPTARWGRFIGWTLGLATLAMLLCISATLAVDPFGVRRIAAGASADLQTTTRSYMATRIAQSSGGDLVILGSSTARNVDPKRISRQRNETVFNAALSGATPLESSLLLQEMIARWHPAPRVVWLIDVDSTFADVVPGAGVLAAPQLRHSMGRMRRAQLWVRLVLRRHTDMSALRAAWKLHGHSPPTRVGPQLTLAQTFRRDGFRVWDPLKGVNRDTARVNRLAAYRTSFYSGGAVIDHAAQADFRDGLQEANHAGITPLVVLMPVSSSFADDLRSFGRPRHSAAVDHLLRSIADEGNIRYVDMRAAAQSVDAFTSRQPTFIDGVHMDVRSSTDVVLAALQRSKLS